MKKSIHHTTPTTARTYMHTAIPSKIAAVLFTHTLTVLAQSVVQPTYQQFYSRLAHLCRINFPTGTARPKSGAVQD
jgi:hypothetical protein